MFISNERIDRYIEEDVPYFDLTTWTMGFKEKRGRIEYYTREDCVLCGTEEVERIFQRLNLKVIYSIASGTKIEKDTVFFRGEGKAGDLHKAWKVGQNLFDFCSGVATKTERVVKAAQQYQPNISILTTRKSYPGSKALLIKSILAGGAFPHRLGLSETILVFRQHMNFVGGFEGFLETVPSLMAHACEKKVIVEAESVDEAKQLCQAGVDGIQFDKVAADVLSQVVPEIKEKYSHITLLAAGGIHEGNVEQYAKSGVDGLVMTGLYYSKPTDIGVRLTALG